MKLIIGFSAGTIVVAGLILLAVRSSHKKPIVIPAPLEYRLQGISGTYTGRRFPVSGIVRMGRLKEVNDLIFPDGIGVSGKHCMLKEEDGKVYLTDLNSRNGTWVNNQRLQPNEARLLHAGDSFYLGRITESFRLDVNGRDNGRDTSRDGMK